MHDTPLFLVRLGLGTDADARAVRRAYAREVKLIDQEHEAARFQDLREAYEVALRWAVYQASRMANGEASAPAGGDGAASVAAGDNGASVAAAEYGATMVAADVDAVLSANGIAAAHGAKASMAALRPSAIAPDAPAALLFDPRALAEEAFAAFLNACPALAQASWDDVAAWSAALRERLDSDTLINIEARSRFENMVAQVLAQGWRPGHHTLLRAATVVFNWGDDRRRLHQFGHAGAVVSQAFDDYFRFSAQALRDYTVQNDILERLRLSQVPDNTHIRRYMPHVELMLERYPVFMAVTVDEAAVAEWRGRHRDLPVMARDDDDTDDGADMSYIERRAARMRTLMGSVLISFFVLFVLAALSTRYLAPAPTSAGFYPPGAAPSEQHEEAAEVANPPPGFEPISDAQMMEIDARIRYHPAKPPAHALEATYMVYVSAMGEVVALDKRAASDDLDYDKAVADAIRATWFKSTLTPHKFPLTFSTASAALAKARPKAR